MPPAVRLSRAVNELLPQSILTSTACVAAKNIVLSLMVGLTDGSESVQSTIVDGTLNDQTVTAFPLDVKVPVNPLVNV
ncbi:MAG: hypothetical protein IPP12_21840 [Nitrospira sp.]|nr:hypothetical protein [Nitrospira sp.]